MRIYISFALVFLCEGRIDRGMIWSLGLKFIGVDLKEFSRTAVFQSDICTQLHLCYGRTARLARKGDVGCDRAP